MRHTWILAAYPKDYRRDHGDELLEPMLVESRRSTLREAANLIVHGLRTRLGRPVSRGVVVWAVLVAVLGGAFGVAAGSWAGQQVTGPLPRPEWTRALLADVLPDGDFGVVPIPPSSPFQLGDDELTWRNAGDLLFNGAGHRASPQYAQALFPTADGLGARAGRVADRLTATGWDVRAGSPGRLRATRGDVTLTLEMSLTQDPRTATVSVAFTHSVPAASWIGAAVGALIAAAVAFLVFAWASRRTGRPGHPARLAVLFPLMLATFFWCVPTTLALVVAATPGRATWMDITGPSVFSLLLGIGAVFAALALLLAALPVRPEFGSERVSRTPGPGEVRDRVS
ncbi:hypothetical protein [Actinoplanes couchii]|uniref:Uncharacterized protein n=1 Tax=Actinoplanes couchii TaxID=403638 RepID=A0ABQ3XEM4_9ACTN|nr:hypothetical protein [Actinoplanes couchii]MDR6319829.1 hypothetical protein [Actinoplanes couchii]GID56964.1 hypothetical protein Aco03nite_053680 [Actinoplanes couchii]